MARRWTTAVCCGTALLLIGCNRDSGSGTAAPPGQPPTAEPSRQPRPPINPDSPVPQPPDVLSGPNGSILTAEWSPDGRLIAAGAADNTVWLWEAATGRKVAEFRGHTDAVTAVRWSPDGQTLASGGLDWRIRLWDVARQSEMAALSDFRFSAIRLAWRPDGKVLAAGGGDGRVVLWDVARRVQAKPVIRSLDNRVLALAWRPDGKALAVAGRDTRVFVWDTTSGKTLAVLPAGLKGVPAIAWSPDGKRLAMASTVSPGQIEICDARSRLVTARLTGHTDIVGWIAWHSGGRLASGGLDGTARVWDPEAGQQIDCFTTDAKTNPIHSVAWRPDGTAIAIGLAKGTVVIRPVPRNP